MIKGTRCSSNLEGMNIMTISKLINAKSKDLALCSLRTPPSPLLDDSLLFEPAMAAFSIFISSMNSFSLLAQSFLATEMRIGVKGVLKELSGCGPNTPWSSKGPAMGHERVCSASKPTRQTPIGPHLITLESIPQ
ncbi:hypothetical protein E2542_SST05678 [Spatholobus suberectus]|nr:hypothetical protein E2542_SST05678 [Spatholobus suberectus]